VCVKRQEDGCVHLVGYFNYPLNNKNINYHLPMVFPVLGFLVNNCVNCVIVVVSGLFLVLFSFPLKPCYVYAFDSQQVVPKHIVEGSERKGEENMFTGYQSRLTETRKFV
jgi:hypothetical protein